MGTAVGNTFEKVITIAVTPSDGNYLEVAAAMNSDCKVDNDHSVWQLCHHTESSDTYVGDHSIFLNYLESKIQGMLTDTGVNVYLNFTEFGTGDGGVGAD